MESINDRNYSPILWRAHDYMHTADTEDRAWLQRVPDLTQDQQELIAARMIARVGDLIAQFQPVFISCPPEFEPTLDKWQDKTV